MASLADTFAAALSELQREDIKSRRKTEATIRKAKQLIEELKQQEEKWAREDELTR